MVESTKYGAPDYVFLLTLSSALVLRILNLRFPEDKDHVTLPYSTTDKTILLHIFRALDRRLKGKLF